MIRFEDRNPFVAPNTFLLLFFCKHVLILTILNAFYAQYILQAHIKYKNALKIKKLLATRQDFAMHLFNLLITLTIIWAQNLT